jgi:hypothetical protein
MALDKTTDDDFTTEPSNGPRNEWLRIHCNRHSGLWWSTKSALERGIHQVRQHVGHLVSQMYRVLFADAFLECKRKQP